MDKNYDIRLVEEGELPLGGYGVTLKFEWAPREVVDTTQIVGVEKSLDTFREEIQYYIVYTGSLREF